MAPADTSQQQHQPETGNRSRGRPDSSAEAESTVFLGNISRGLTQARLRAWLQEHYGDVRNVRFVFDRKTQHHRGFGFALFNRPETAKRFFRDYGSSGLYMDGHYIKVCARDKTSSSSGSGSGKGSGSDSDPPRRGRPGSGGSGSGSGTESDPPPALCDSGSGSSDDGTRVQRHIPRAVPAPQSVPLPAVIPQALPVAQGVPTALPAAVTYAQAIRSPSIATHVPPVGTHLCGRMATAVPFVVAAQPQVAPHMRMSTAVQMCAGVPSVAPGMLMGTTAAAAALGGMPAVRW
eukprot:TRINITY_DN14533_c0_g2_i1.p1 TRINITY_DN14533_c0_g2~~TRINITY_DN14533_c0_g2_i1.p1  ORF type:complete len:323 (+),score=29.26 TRINITY_DN14533_c0_g2_i1:97-969(+)